MAVSMFINQNMAHITENGGIENLADIRDTSLDPKVVGTRLAKEQPHEFQFQGSGAIQYR